MLELNENLSSVQGEVDALLRKLQPTEVPVDPRYNSPEGILFRKALALIAEEKHWCGYKPSGRDGERRCQAVALYTANGKSYNELYITVRDAVARAQGMHEYCWVKFNDTHTYAEVIAKWHEAGIANGWL